MKTKDKIEIIFMIMILLQLACIIGLTIRLGQVFDRLNKLESDYKIYELNLQNLEENREVQFEQ